MKLYTTTLAPNPRRVRIFMEEKGIEIPVQEISIMEGEHKQEEYKNTIYVRDLKKILVKEWGLTDDSSDVMVFGKNGEVLYSVDGKFTDNQVKEIIKVVKENL